MSILMYVLIVLGMTGIAGAGFWSVMALGAYYHWGWVAFEQASVFGCFLASILPLIVYSRSSDVKDKILSIAQATILGVTGLTGSVVPLFLDRGLSLFVVWFFLAGVALTVLVRLTTRLAQRNGVRLTPGEAVALQERIDRSRLVESSMEELVQQQLGYQCPDQALITGYQDALAVLKGHRMHSEEYLARHVSVRPPPVFGG